MPDVFDQVAPDTGDVFDQVAPATPSPIQQFESGVGDVARKSVQKPALPSDLTPWPTISPEEKAARAKEMDDALSKMTWKDYVAGAFNVATDPQMGGSQPLSKPGTNIKTHAEQAATPGTRLAGAGGLVGDVGDLASPLLGIGALESPVSTAVGLGTGMAGGKGARAVTKAAGGGEGAQDLAENLGYWIPALTGAVVRPRVGVGVTPEEVVIRGGVNPPGVGPKAGEIRIPRGPKPTPPAPAGTTIEPPTIEGNAQPMTREEAVEHLEANRGTPTVQNPTGWDPDLAKPVPEAPKAPIPDENKVPKAQRASTLIKQDEQAKLAQAMEGRGAAKEALEKQDVFDKVAPDEQRSSKPTTQRRPEVSRENVPTRQPSEINAETNKAPAGSKEKEIVGTPQTSAPPATTGGGGAVPEAVRPAPDVPGQRETPASPSFDTPEFRAHKASEDAYVEQAKKLLPENPSNKDLIAKVMELKKAGGGSPASGPSVAGEKPPQEGQLEGKRPLQVSKNGKNDRPADFAETPEKDVFDEVAQYKHRSTQANIEPDSEAGKALISARERIEPTDLHGKGKDIGGDHVTVRYGLKNDSDLSGVKSFLASQSPFEATLGKTDAFPASESSDGAAVIHAPIESPELERINKEIEKHGEFAESNFKEFLPHSTIAYVSPDKANRYKGMTVTQGKKFTVNSIAITDRDGQQEEIKLQGNTGSVLPLGDESRDDATAGGGKVTTRDNSGRGLSNNESNTVAGSGRDNSGRETNVRPSGSLSREGGTDTKGQGRSSQVPSGKVHELEASRTDDKGSAREGARPPSDSLRQGTPVQPQGQANGVERLQNLSDRENEGLSGGKEKTSASDRMGSARPVQSVRNEPETVLRSGDVRSVLSESALSRQTDLETEISDLQSQRRVIGEKIGPVSGMYGQEKRGLVDQANALVRQIQDRQDELAKLRGEPTRAEKKELQKNEAEKTFAERPKKALDYASPKQSQHWQVMEPDYIQKRFEQRAATYEHAIKERQKEFDAAKPGSKSRSDALMQLEYDKKMLQSLKDKEPRLAQQFKTEYTKLVKTAVSHGSPVPDEVIAQKSEFSLARDARERYEKGRHTSFANKSAAVNDTMQKEEGFKVKRQDGKPITDEQIQEIRDSVKDIEKVFGSMADIMRGIDLTIVHTSGTYPFLMNDAAGLYSDVERRITLGLKGIWTKRAYPVFAHEFGHLIDIKGGNLLGSKARVYTKGGKGYEISSLAEADRNSTLIAKAKQAINDVREVRDLFRLMDKKTVAEMTEEEKGAAEIVKVKLGPYYYEPREVFARLFEQYVGNKLGRGGAGNMSPEAYTKVPGYWTQAEFDKLVPELEKEITRRLDALKERYAPSQVPDGVAAPEPPPAPIEPKTYPEPTPGPKPRKAKEIESPAGLKTGDVVTFSKIPPGSYLTPDTPFRVEHVDAKSVHFRNVKTGGATSDPHGMIKLSEFTKEVPVVGPKAPEWHNLDEKIVWRGKTMTRSEAIAKEPDANSEILAARPAESYVPKTKQAAEPPAKNQTYQQWVAGGRKGLGPMGITKTQDLLDDWFAKLKAGTPGGRGGIFDKMPKEIAKAMYEMAPEDRPISLLPGEIQRLHDRMPEADREPIPSLEERATKEGAQRIVPAETVPKAGKNFEGRYLQAALEPVQEAWEKSAEKYDKHSVSWNKITDSKLQDKDGVQVNMHDPDGNHVAALSVRKSRDGFEVLARGMLKTSDTKSGISEVWQTLNTPDSLAEAKRIAEARLRSGQIYSLTDDWYGAGYSKAPDIPLSKVRPYSSINPADTRPEGFDKEKLLVKIPDDGTFVIPNNPASIDKAIKATENFELDKEPASSARRVPGSPKDFNAEKYITGLEKEVADLQDRIKKGAGLQTAQLEQELKAAQENLKEAKSSTPEQLAGRSSEAGFATVGAINPLEVAKSAKKVYSDFIDKIIREKLDLGDKYRRVAEHDKAIASMLHEKDNAPRYFRDKADSNVTQVTKGLSEDQVRLTAMMADNQIREYLQEEHPDQYDEARNDPAVMKAVQTFKKYQDELAAIRIKLGWHVRRDLSSIENEDGTWSVVDQDGDEVDSFKTFKQSQDYVEDNGKLLDHLKRTYPEHMREPLMGATNEPSASGAPYGGIRPPRPDKKQRIASAEYFFQHGAKDFAGYVKSFTQAYHAALNQKIYDSLTGNAELWKEGTALPPQIEYRGKAYYSPDVAKSMKLAKPENRPKVIEEYRAYDPARDDKALIKSFEDGWSTQTTGRPGISPSDRYLAPKDVVDALDHYDMTRGVQEGDSIRRFFQEQIVGLFGPTVHVFNIMRRLANVAGNGVWDPRAWPMLVKLLGSSELRARMAEGLADDAIDALSKHGTYTNTRDIGSLHDYVLGNMDPRNWARWTIGKFSKGVLFDPKFLGGFGGLDQKARVLAYDYLRDEAGMGEEEAARNVEDGFGNYNKANWTERMRRWARALLFPGWDFSSLKWFLRHPIKTAAIPALATMAANLALNKAGKNKDQDKYDFGYLHYGDRKYRSSLFTESMAMHIAQPILEAGKAALEGGSAKDVAVAAGEGAIRGGGGLAGSLRPEIQAAAELLSNRQYLGGNKEITKAEDANYPGKVFPTRKLDKQAAFVLVKAFPAISRFLDSSYDNVDVATGFGSVTGVTNYKSGAEERLRANGARAKGYSQTLSILAESDPDAASKFVEDPQKAMYLTFNKDFSELEGALKDIDKQSEQVKLAPGISKSDRDEALKGLEESRKQVLNSADAIADAMQAARLQMKK